MWLISVNTYRQSLSVYSLSYNNIIYDVYFTLGTCMVYMTLYHGYNQDQSYCLWSIPHSTTLWQQCTQATRYIILTCMYSQEVIPRLSSYSRLHLDSKICVLHKYSCPANSKWLAPQSRKSSSLFPLGSIVFVVGQYFYTPQLTLHTMFERKCIYHSWEVIP